MKKWWTILLAIFCSAPASVVRAVAVPPEFLQTESGRPCGILYAAILIVFVIGLLLGYWVQKKLETK